MTENRTLSVNMRTTVSLLVVFTISIILALMVTVISSATEVQLLSIVVVVPLILLCIIFIHYCLKGKPWSYVGTSVLGSIGVLLRIVVSSQPNLEVGGGLPVGVTALYVVLGALVSLKAYESVLELRQWNIQRPRN
jgi:hypothetical protein